MPMYLVVHTPREDIDEDEVFPATRMLDMARDHGADGERTRWIRAWSPDLHDERHFTLWDARSAADIEEVMARYHFLSEMTHHVIAVQEWTPDSVIASGDPSDF